MWYIWLIIAGAFLIGEIITTGFLIFWLAIGSLFAMVVSLFTANIFIQTAVFVVSSIILIFATKPFVNKFAKNKNEVKTNVYSIVERPGLVIAEIDPLHETGQVKVDGEVWSAISKDSTKLTVGTKVKVVEIKGVKAVVTAL